jgi:hypothetical protein
VESGLAQSVTGAGSGLGGRAFAMPWCGRCPSWKVEFPQGVIKCRWFQISIRLIS